MSIPSVGSYGRYKLSPPAGEISAFDDKLTCKAIRQISDYIAMREDVLSIIYIPLGISILDAMSMVEEDTKNNTSIVSLQSDKGNWVYVPEYLIIQIPEQEGELAAKRRISFNLPITPLYQDFQYVVDGCVDLALKVSGLRTTGRVTTISKEFMYSPSKHQVVNTNRALTITSRGTYYSSSMEALAGLKSTINKIGILELYLMNHQGGSGTPIVTFISTPTVDSSAMTSDELYTEVQTSPYHANYDVDHHFGSNFMVMDAATSTIVYQTGDCNTLTSCKVPLDVLMPGASYMLKVAYISRSNAANASKWTAILNPPASVDKPTVTAALSKVGGLHALTISSTTFVGHACKLKKYEYTITDPNGNKYIVVKDTHTAFNWVLRKYQMQMQGNWIVSVKDVANRGVSAVSDDVTIPFKITLTAPVLTLKVESTAKKRIPVITITPTAIDSSGGLVVKYEYTITDPEGKKYVFTKTDATPFTWSPSDLVSAVAGDWTVSMGYTNVKGVTSPAGSAICNIKVATLEKPTISLAFATREAGMHIDGGGIPSAWIVSDPVHWTKFSDLSFWSSFPQIEILYSTVIPLIISDGANNKYTLSTAVDGSGGDAHGIYRSLARTGEVDSYLSSGYKLIGTDALPSWMKAAGTPAVGSNLSMLKDLYINIGEKDYSANFDIDTWASGASGMIDGDELTSVTWTCIDLDTGKEVTIDNTKLDTLRTIKSLPRSVKGWSVQVGYKTKFGAAAVSDAVTITPAPLPVTVSATPYVEFSDGCPPPFVDTFIGSNNSVVSSDLLSKTFRILSDGQPITGSSIAALCTGTTMSPGKPGTLDSIYTGNGVEIVLTAASGKSFTIPEKSVIYSAVLDAGSSILYSTVLAALGLGTPGSNMKEIQNSCSVIIRLKT
jgi:hypothetical protein